MSHEHATPHNPIHDAQFTSQSTLAGLPMGDADGENAEGRHGQVKHGDGRYGEAKHGQKIHEEEIHGQGKHGDGKIVEVKNSLKRKRGKPDEKNKLTRRGSLYGQDVGRPRSTGGPCDLTHGGRPTKSAVGTIWHEWGMSEYYPYWRKTQIKKESGTPPETTKEQPQTQSVVSHKRHASPKRRRRSHSRIGHGPKRHVSPSGVRSASPKQGREKAHKSAEFATVTITSLKSRPPIFDGDIPEGIKPTRRFRRSSDYTYFNRPHCTTRSTSHKKLAASPILSKPPATPPSPDTPSTPSASTRPGTPQFPATGQSPTEAAIKTSLLHRLQVPSFTSRSRLKKPTSVFGFLGHSHYNLSEAMLTPCDKVLSSTTQKSSKYSEEHMRVPSPQSLMFPIPIPSSQLGITPSKVRQDQPIRNVRGENMQFRKNLD